MTASRPSEPKSWIRRGDSRWATNGRGVKVQEVEKRVRIGFTSRAGSLFSAAPQGIYQFLTMKVLSSLSSAKRRHTDCQVVNRKGTTYVICKSNPKFKARQGATKGTRLSKKGVK